MLLPEVNEKKTREKVDALLKNYHRIRRLAGAPFEQRITATYTLEPQAPSNPSSAIERGVIRKIEAQEKLADIDRAINCLSGQARQRIYFKYLSTDHRFDYERYMDLNISKDTYYRNLGKAQMEFAEAYKGGELITYV